MENAKIETRELKGRTILRVTLPNGDEYDIELHQDCIDVRSNCNWDGKDMIVRPRVSNEVRILATELKTITP